MKSKKAIFSLLLILISVIIYIVLYNKTYQIKVNANEVYEIEIQTCDKLGFKKEIITNTDEIKEYLNKVQSLKFTHPTFYTGKGWITDVDIKIKKDNGAEFKYQYNILNDYINIGSFRYKIIPK